MVGFASIRKTWMVYFCLILALLIFASPGFASQKSKFESSYSSKLSVDSTRKEYYVLDYDNDWNVIGIPKSYDKNFFSSTNDLYLSLKNDLSKTQVLDFSETLHYQRYRPEDFEGVALDISRYTYVDHLFQMTWGLTLGKKDALQVDYLNNIYRIPVDELSEYISNTGKARFNHKVNENTSLGFEGDYEFREYVNDKSSSYRETTAIIEFSKFFPEKIRYRPISRSMRGTRETFENSPNGLSARKAVDYYTNWTPDPNDPDSQAKYIPYVTRGDLSLTLTGDYRERDRHNINQKYKQPNFIVKIKYTANPQLQITLDDTYYIRKYDTSTQALRDYWFLYDHRSNHFSLSGTWQPNRRFTHILSGTNEFYSHTDETLQDYILNTFSWETYFSEGRHNASLYLADTLTRYGAPREYYPDNDSLRAIVSYDYTLSNKWVFHLKDEWMDYDVKKYEDPYSYSSYVINTWKAAFETYLDKHNSLELGYQNKREKHAQYYMNDITEKTLYFTWNASI